MTFTVFGLIDFTELNNIYSITNLNKYIIEYIEDEVTVRAKEHDKKNKGAISEQTAYNWVNHIKFIEDYFEVNK